MFGIFFILPSGANLSYRIPRVLELLYGKLYSFEKVPEVIQALVNNVLFSGVARLNGAGYQTQKACPYGAGADGKG